MMQGHAMDRLADRSDPPPLKGRSLLHRGRLKHRRSRYHVSIIVRDGQPFLAGQPVSQPAHLRMLALPVCIKSKLANDIPGIHSSDARDEVTIPASIQAMAGVTRSLWSCIASG